MFFNRVNESFGLNFDSQVNDFKAVVTENNIHQIFANVVNVAFDRGQNNFSTHGGIFLLHELL